MDFYCEMRRDASKNVKATQEFAVPSDEAWPLSWNSNPRFALRWLDVVEPESVRFDLTQLVLLTAQAAAWSPGFTFCPTQLSRYRASNTRSLRESWGQGHPTQRSCEFFQPFAGRFRGQRW